MSEGVTRDGADQIRGGSVVFNGASHSQNRLLRTPTPLGRRRRATLPDLPNMGMVTVPQGQERQAQIRILREWSTTGEGGQSRGCAVVAVGRSWLALHTCRGY